MAEMDSEGGLRERVAVLESNLRELSLVRQRVHDMAGSIQVLVANGEEARDARQELVRKVDALTEAVSRLAITSAQLSTTMVAHGEQTRSLIDKVDKISIGMEQHDRRDDDRFNADGSRITAIEKHIELDSRGDQTQHTHHTAMQTTIWTIAGMIATALLTYLLTHH